MGICVTLGPKRLIIAGQLTSSSSLLVITCKPWKQVLIWRCHKTKQPGMRSQHMRTFALVSHLVLQQMALARTFTVARQDFGMVCYHIMMQPILFSTGRLHTGLCFSVLEFRVVLRKAHAAMSSSTSLPQFNNSLGSLPHQP